MHRESRDSEFVKSRLQSGGATGATRFKTLDGAGVLRVRVNKRGRGLFAVSLIKKGEPTDNCVFLLLKVRCWIGQKIAQGSGKLVPEQYDTPGCHQYQWFDKKVFMFDPPSYGNLAVLVNTPVSMEAGAVSNARYSRIRKTIQMRVRWSKNDILPKWKMILFAGGCNESHPTRWRDSRPVRGGVF